ncbi:MAG: flavin reductase family protein [Longimicrobiales bacterium]
MTRPIEAQIRSAGGRDDQGERVLRDAFARWATGVTIVAARHAAGVQGLTVSAFTPVSLDPPLLLVSIYGDAPVLAHIQEAARFVVNVLDESQRGAASRFSDRFPVGAMPFPSSGDPVLEGALASFVCDVDSVHEAGTHRLVVGLVRRVVLGGEGRPLLYYERAYRGLAEP